MAWWLVAKRRKNTNARENIESIHMFDVERNDVDKMYIQILQHSDVCQGQIDFYYTGSPSKGYTANYY